MARPAVALIVLVAGAAVAGCRLMTSAGVAPPTGVVVITLDTTRADRLSPYGFMNVSLPHLERLARESVVFDMSRTGWPRWATSCPIGSGRRTAARD